MEQPCDSMNATCRILETAAWDRNRVSRQEHVNWFATLLPLIALIVVFLTGTLIFLVVKKKGKRVKRGDPDPEVCMDPDPTAKYDVHRRFLSD